MDTSQAERVFSLMNDLKTAQRSSLGIDVLKDLMIWHTLAKDLKCEQLPVMSILKEFRAMAGERGRKPHRPTQPLRYDYQLASKARERLLSSAAASSSFDSGV